ncbi:MAG: DEAD/DEAH box helicase [Bacteroidetes bacterium]|nr:MAG: DEAD/DEAH box helicase [Bacteroidota bacterium]
MIDRIKAQLKRLQEDPDLSPLSYRQGQTLYVNGQVQTLSQGANQIEVLIDDEYGDFQVAVQVLEDGLVTHTQGARESAPHHVIAALMQYHEEVNRSESRPLSTGKAYTREGMIRRVLAEREERARKAEYRVEFADNPYGEHVLYNEKGVPYKLTFHDLPAETGYCSCPDHRTNKLGTCKHLMFAYQVKKGDKQSLRKPCKSFPFVEVGLDPLKDYQIRWFHPDPEEIEPGVKKLLTQYFGEDSHLPEDPQRIRKLLYFTQEARAYKQILIRPEVEECIERAYQQQVLEQVADSHEMDLSMLKAKLYPYQLAGVKFAAYKEAVIIADEMGLGKTLQAIATALVKKDAFGFRRTLIVCPASLKDQWKNEIEKFTDEQAEVVSGKPEEREEIYRESEAHFLIINYETVLRDREAINRMDTDFIILDEAQRIKNYETLTARSIKRLQKKHALVITGTPIENRLTDLFSIMDFLDPYFLTPLWEFSYRHCYFDASKKNKIVGYYNLQELKERLKPLLLRRTKREVIKELPHVTHLDVPVPMHPVQAEFHANYARGAAQLLAKKFLTPYDMNRLMMMLNGMRMVCDSTFLVDQEGPQISPKLQELRHILLEKLDLIDSDRKVIIFSEWTRMNGLIGKLLRDIGVKFVELNGKVPIPKRQALVDTFYQDPECKVFVSTEAGGAGLNLQVADTVINFELPWNPAKKNQRIGRIDRLGQESDQLTVINFITRDSIEVRIATGLMLKENLFENVLDSDAFGDAVDFSEKGRAQFLQELMAVIDDMVEPGPTEDEEGETVPSELREMVTEAAVPSPTEEPQEEPGSQQPVQGASFPSTKETASSGPENPRPRSPQTQQMEEVMNQGLSFLAGMFKMMTGQDLPAENQRVEIDEETGEVVMRFKMPTGGK